MTADDLVARLSGQSALLDALADAWLAAGADWFAIWSDGRPLRRWPVGAEPAGPASLTAPLRARRRTVGELRVGGLADEPAARRLAAEAELLAGLLGLEADVESLTSELIDSQDLVLALYGLAEAARSHLEPAE